MQCEILRNNERIAGPMPYDAGQVRDIIMRQGGDYRLVPNGIVGAIKVGALSVLPVKVVKPSADRMTELGAAERAVSESEVTYTHTLQERDVDAVRDELLGELARIHDNYDSGRFEYRGVNIASDLEARVNAEGILSKFKAGEMTAAMWRGKPVTTTETDADGNEVQVEGPSKFPVASTEEMQAVYDAVFAHLNAGFAAREIVEDLLNAANEVDLADLDVNAEWNDALAQVSAAA